MTGSRENKERLRRIGKLDQDSVLELAAYMLINIHDLHSAAKTLLQAESFGLARSMGIIALEELGKFIFAMNYFTGESTYHDFLDRVWSHKSKQASGHLIALFSDLMRLLPEVQPSNLSQTGSETFIRQVVARFMSNPNVFEAEVARLLPDAEKYLQDATSAQIERRRQSGFYVSPIADDVRGVTIEHPRLVKKEDAEAVLRLLAIFEDGVINSWMEPMATDYTGDLQLDGQPLETVIPLIKNLLRALASELGAVPEPIEMSPAITSSETV